MNFKEKYLYYKKKYIILKKLVGGRIHNINLDKFKELFNKVLHLDFEVGFNLYYDTNKGKINFEVSKGTDFITIPYKQVIGIHTHYKSKYPEWEYHPPSLYDYQQAIFDYFQFNPINIVIEKAGMWIYKLNENLIKEIKRIFPNIKKIKHDFMKEGEYSKSVEGPTDKFLILLDVILNNANLNGIDIKDVSKYIKIMNNIADPENNDNTENLGFDVEFIPFDKPFNISLDLTDERKKIFNEIKERRLNLFNENDVDIITYIANVTDEYRILRK